MIRGIVLAGLLSFTISTQANDVDNALKDQVVQALDALEADHPEWSYTRTQHKKEETIVERYDSSRTLNEQWQLISVDGKTPTAERLKEYQENRAEARKKAEEKKAKKQEKGKTGRMVDRDSLKLLDENDHEWIFSFKPEMGKDGEDFEKALQGRLHLNKKDQYISHLNMENTASISPVMSVTIKVMKVDIEFALLDDNAVMPVRMHNLVQGKALFFKTLDEETQESFSDFSKVIPLATP